MNLPNKSSKMNLPNKSTKIKVYKDVYAYTI